jgi:hypothetical protein
MIQDNLKNKIIILLVLFFGLFYVFGISHGLGIYAPQSYTRWTSLSLINGYLYLPLNPVTHLDNDLQLFSGGVHTNWGYAVALLQLPFHLIYIIFGTNNFFPDILILYFYLALSALWVYSYIRTKITDNFSSVLLTVFVIFISTLWLTSYRFLVYEETGTYYILGLLCYCLTYLTLLEKFSNKIFIIQIVLSILMLNTRPTAIVIISLTNFHLLYTYRKIKLVQGFIYPTISYFIINYFRSGNIFSNGDANTNPGDNNQLPLNRLGDLCSLSSIENFKNKFYQFIRVFFVGDPILDTNCYSRFEDSISIKKPYLSHLLNLFYFISLLINVKYKNYFILIVSILGVLFTFLMYLIFSVGITYRYIIDFQFFYFLTIFISIILLYKGYNKILLNLILIISLILFFLLIVNVQKHTVSAGPHKANISQHKWVFDDKYPENRTCYDKPFSDKDKLGWNNNTCIIDRYLNTYINFKVKDNKRYQLYLTGTNIPDIITIVINGQSYKNVLWKSTEFTIKNYYSENTNIFVDFGENSNIVLREILIR